jgi:hypothetical protein
VQWTVPATGSYTIFAKGAAGSGSFNSGGAGASMQGTFNLVSNQVLSILVGEQRPTITTTTTRSGGGGTFVALGADYTTATPLIVAGGGGGNAYNYGGLISLIQRFVCALIQRIRVRLCNLIFLYDFIVFYYYFLILI